MAEWKLFKTHLQEHNDSKTPAPLMILTESGAMAIVGDRVEIIKGEKFIKDDVDINDEIKKLLDGRANLGKGNAKEIRLKHKIIDCVVAKTILQLYNQNVVQIRPGTKGKMQNFDVLQTISDYVGSLLTKNNIPGMTNTQIIKYLEDKVKKNNI